MSKTKIKKTNIIINSNKYTVDLNLIPELEFVHFDKFVEYMVDNQDKTMDDRLYY
jgi:hypothetical protein